MKRDLRPAALFVLSIFVVAMVTTCQPRPRAADLQPIRYLRDVDAASGPAPACRGWFAAELPWWIPREAQQWEYAPQVQPIVPSTTCPLNTEMYFGRCRNDCRFAPCGRKRLA
jgi:hypothetical protein